MISENIEQQVERRLKKSQDRVNNNKQTVYYEQSKVNRSPLSQFFPVHPSGQSQMYDGATTVQLPPLSQGFGSQGYRSMVITYFAL